MFKVKSAAGFFTREYWLTFDGKKSSAEDKFEKKKAQGAILKSFKSLTSDTRTRTYKLETKH